MRPMCLCLPVTRSTMSKRRPCARVSPCARSCQPPSSRSLGWRYVGGRRSHVVYSDGGPPWPSGAPGVQSSARRCGGVANPVVLLRTGVRTLAVEDRSRSTPPAPLSVVLQHASLALRHDQFRRFAMAGCDLESDRGFPSVDHARHGNLGRLLQVEQCCRRLTPSTSVQRGGGAAAVGRDPLLVRAQANWA